jgi:hypothetical protein
VFIWNRTNPEKKLIFGSYLYIQNFYAQNTIEFINIFVKDDNDTSINNLSPKIKKSSKSTEKE